MQPHVHGAATARRHRKRRCIIQTCADGNQRVQRDAFAVRRRFQDFSAHEIDVVHDTADAIRRQPKSRFQNRFQQLTAAVSQAILYADRRRHDEIQRMRMDQMVVAACQRDMHVRHLPSKPPLLQRHRQRLLHLMLISRHDVLHRHFRLERDTAAARRRLDEKIQNRPTGLRHRVIDMAAGRFLNCLLVDDGRFRERRLQLKTRPQYFLQNLQLNRSHDTQIQLVQRLDVVHLQQRIFFGKRLASRPQRAHLLRFLRQDLHVDQR